SFGRSCARGRLRAPSQFMRSFIFDLLRSTALSRTHRRRSASLACALVASLSTVPLHVARAQDGARKEPQSRLERYGHELAYGTVLGFGWAGIDQARTDPAQRGQEGRG